MHTCVEIVRWTKILDIIRFPAGVGFQNSISSLKYKLNALSVSFFSQTRWECVLLIYYLRYRSKGQEY